MTADERDGKVISDQMRMGLRHSQIVNNVFNAGNEKIKGVAFNMSRTHNNLG